MKLNWYELFWLQNAALNDLMEKHRTVFGSDLGTAKGFKAKIPPHGSSEHVVYRIFIGTWWKLNL